MGDISIIARRLSPELVQYGWSEATSTLRRLIGDRMIWRRGLWVQEV